MLIYPEGKLTVGGPYSRSSPCPSRTASGGPVRGDVELVFGKPLIFAAATDFNEATNRIEKAVASL